jgi:hypothetical protein
MSITLYGSNTGLKIEANLNIANISGVGGVLPRILFQVKLVLNDEVGWHFREKIQAWSFGALTGELLIGSEKIADIKTYSVNRTRLGNQNYPTDFHLNIEIPLDARRIEWLEQQRAGKSFEAKIRIDLQVQLFGNNQHTAAFSCGLLDTLSIQGEIPFVVPDTQWREQVLPGLGYGKVMVVELPVVSLESCAALKHSYKALGNAQKQFTLGLYDETAGSCRVALDQFFEQVPKEEGSDKTIPKLKKSWETKLGVSTYQWLDDALGAIKEVTNKPHHSPNNHFDRFGAQMLLMITTTLVSYAAQQLSGDGQA